MWACQESPKRLINEVRNSPSVETVESRISTSSVSAPAFLIAQKSCSFARCQSAPSSCAWNTTHERSITSRSDNDVAALFKDLRAATEASMLHPVAIWGPSSTASTTTWLSRTVESERKGVPWAAHEPRNDESAICTTSHSASVNTRLAVYNHTRDVSGRDMA